MLYQIIEQRRGAAPIIHETVEAGDPFQALVRARTVPIACFRWPFVDPEDQTDLRALSLRDPSDHVHWWSAVPCVQCETPHVSH